MMAFALLVGINYDKETKEHTCVIDEDFKPSEVNDSFAYGVNAKMHTQGSYTIEDYKDLPDDLRVELIDGYFINMEAPTTLHQSIVVDISSQFAFYVKNKKKL
jgi:hypothetical protein